MMFIDLITALKTHFEADSSLSFLESISIRKYTRDSLPGFTNYCLIISPKSRKKQLIANRLQQLTVTIEFVIVVRNFHNTLSIVGEIPGQIGYLKAIEDIENSISAFQENNTESLTVLYDEMDEPVDFSYHRFQEREDFFHEIILPYTVRLSPIEF
jgi:hypothetical protein